MACLCNVPLQWHAYRIGIIYQKMTSLEITSLPGDSSTLWPLMLGGCLTSRPGSECMSSLLLSCLGTIAFASALKMPAWPHARHIDVIRFLAKDQLLRCLVSARHRQGVAYEAGCESNLCPRTVPWPVRAGLSPQASPASSPSDYGSVEGYDQHIRHPRQERSRSICSMHAVPVLVSNSAAVAAAARIVYQIYST